jgi:hypothetical protein
VSITIYNLLGDKVTTLVDHEIYQAGQYNVVRWNGKNSDGEVCASGIYILLLQGPGYTEVSKCAVVK